MHLEKKTNINQISEKEYRKLRERLNYSGLKKFATNRAVFYKEFIIGDVKPEKDQSVSVLIGDIVHTLMAGGSEEFDKKFCLSSVMEPVGQVLELTNNLYRRTIKSLNEAGEVTEDFSVLITDAIQETKYDYSGKEIAFKGKDLEKIIAMFTDPEKGGELYYREKLANHGKTVVSISNIQSAEKLCDQLRSHEYTRDIVNLVTGDGVEVFNELVVLYEIDGVEYRSMIDKLIIDHNKKLITPYDYKCSFDIENGFQYSYLKFMYHLQAGLYDSALWHFKREHGWEYKISPMIYITLDTTGQSAPVLYKLTDKDIDNAKHGFIVRGKKYPGTLALQKRIQWHINSGIWETAKEVYDSKGVVGLEIDYEK